MEERYSKNLIGAAEEMPPAKYSYKPTPGADHLRAPRHAYRPNPNNALCAAIAGEPARETKLSETDSKEALTKALQDSFTYCEAGAGQGGRQRARSGGGSFWRSHHHSRSGFWCTCPPIGPTITVPRRCICG